MKTPLALSLSLLLAVDSVAAQSVQDALPRSTPEEQGIASSAILAFLEAADERIDGMHSFMLVRHGNVVSEGWWSPYNAESRHSLYSLSKSFTSTAVGMAVAEGKMSLDDRVLPYFPDDAPAEPGEFLKAMRVRDLLAMSTGHHADDLAKFAFDAPVRLTKAFLSLPVAHKPGTHFLYNTPATYMLSAIVQQVAGSNVLDYLRPRLFEPLGIQDPVWAASPQGVTLGGFGLSVRTEDIARFGQLYLQKGNWQGRQLIPASWVEAASARQTSNGSNPASDWEQGYGYQFWRCRHNCFRGDGAFGQFCIVLPEHDAVVAITSGVKDMQAVMNLVWERLLPSMQPSALPRDEAAHGKLAAALGRLTLRPQQGSASSSRTAHGINKRFVFPPNDEKVESLMLEQGSCGHEDGVVIEARFNGLDQRLACGNARWLKGRLMYGNLPEQPVAISGAWTSEDTYAVKICFYETPFCLALTLKVSENQMLYDAEYNVAFGPAKKPELVGQAR